MRAWQRSRRDHRSAEKIGALFQHQLEADSAFNIITSKDVLADRCGSLPTAQLCNSITTRFSKWRELHVPPAHRPGDHVAYCASPLPKDQSSLFASTRLMNTSSRRKPMRAFSPSAIAL